MATRKRTLQPNIWQDPEFGYLKPLAQLLFIGCITQADDEGRLQAHPAMLKSIIFPYGRVRLEEVFDALEELQQKMSHFIFYEVDGQHYIQLEKWNAHQVLRADRMQYSTFPAPPKEALSTARPSTDRQAGAEVSKKVSKKVSKAEQKKLNNSLDLLRKDLEEKGIIQKTKLL